MIVTTKYVRATNARGEAEKSAGGSRGYRFPFVSIHDLICFAEVSPTVKTAKLVISRARRRPLATLVPHEQDRQGSQRAETGRLTLFLPTVEPLCKLVRCTFSAVVGERVLTLVHDFDEARLETRLEDGRQFGVFDPVKR